MTAAYQSHFKELKEKFNEKGCGKIDDKIECLLHEAYRLKRKNNNLPFVPATLGEWTGLLFNPEIVRSKYIYHDAIVYVPRQAAPSTASSAST
jgi:hypothetical protein